MKSIFYFFSILLFVSCASKDTSVNNDYRTVQERVVAVKTEGNSTIISSGRLDAWYKINTFLNEGMIYEMTMEIPRVVTDPIIIPAKVLSFTPDDYLQRDLFGRYITKYHELKTAQKDPEK